MNEEFLLRAVGHIDEDLIVQAESYRPLRRSRSWQRSLSALAACAAVAFVLYWGANNLGMGGSSTANGSAVGDASISSVENESNGTVSQETQDFCPAIMVDGQLYWSSGQVLPGEMDESAILGTTTYTDGTPEQDGQANFAREGTRYTRTDGGIAVEMDGAWVLFTPDGP